MGLALLWLSGSEPTVSRSNHSTNMKSSQEGRGNGEGEEIQHLQKCCLAGLLPMPAFNSCTLTAVTWHRIQEGLRCIPAGFTLSAIYQGCVGVCVLNPKGHDAQATYQVTTFTVNMQVSRILLLRITLSSGLRAGQVAPPRQAALCIQGMPGVMGREHLLGPSSSPNHTQHSAHAMWQLGFNSRNCWSGANLVP